MLDLLFLIAKLTDIAAKFSHKVHSGVKVLCILQDKVKDAWCSSQIRLWACDHIHARSLMIHRVFSV